MALQERIAVVTGANKGVGLAIVRQLALQYPNSPSASGPLLVYLTARSKTRGQEAVATLYDDRQLHKAKALRSQGGQTEIRFHTLDISETDSVNAFADYLKDAHPDGIDYVINNAGIAMGGFNDKIVKETLHCNYYGTLSATRALLPQLRPHGRLVNVASMSGHLVNASTSVKSRFLATESVEDVTSLMEDFTAATAAGKEKQQGWPSAAYAVSKAGIIGMTRAIAAEAKKAGNNVLVNSCCPGYVKTDMTGGGGSKTPDQGAQTPVMLALGDLRSRSGGFWQHENEIEW